MDWACTAKTFLDAKPKNLMTTASKTFQMIAIAPPSASSTEQTVQPLKIKIPMQSKPSECKKGKAMYEAKIKKRNKHAKQKTI